jgi:hypothetical protein
VEKSGFDQAIAGSRPDLMLDNFRDQLVRGDRVDAIGSFWGWGLVLFVSIHAVIAWGEISVAVVVGGMVVDEGGDDAVDEAVEELVVAVGVVAAVG